MSEPQAQTRQLQTTENGALQPEKAASGGIANDLDEVARVANMMAKSGFFDDAKTAAQAGVKILAGRELGIPEMAAMRGVHVMEGNTTLSGPLLAALIKRHPKYDYREVESTKERAEIAFYEDGDKVGTASFSMDDANRITAYYDNNGNRKTLADKTNWKNYPSDMLFWRALTRGQRRYAPEVGMGAVYVPDELGAETDRDGNVIEAEATTVDSEPQGNPQGQQESTSGKEKRGSRQSRSSESSKPVAESGSEDSKETSPASEEEEKSFGEILSSTRSFLAKAMRAGNGHLADALQRVADRVEEENFTEEQEERLKRVGLPFQAVDHMRRALHGEVNQERFNETMDWFLSSIREWDNGEEADQAYEIVHNEAQRLDKEIEGFTLEEVEEGEPAEGESSQSEAVESMQRGETALGSSGEAESEKPSKQSELPDHPLPQTFPGFGDLRDAGLETPRQVEKKRQRGTLQEIKGIGPKTEAEIKNALEDMRAGESGLFGDG